MENSDFDLALKSTLKGILEDLKTEIIKCIDESESRLTWKLAAFMAAQTAVIIIVVKLIR